MPKMDARDLAVISDCLSVDVSQPPIAMLVSKVVVNPVPVSCFSTSFEVLLGCFGYLAPVDWNCRGLGGYEAEVRGVSDNDVLEKRGYDTVPSMSLCRSTYIVHERVDFDNPFVVASERRFSDSM